MSGLQGIRLGDYELIELIGEGGMAEVYRARQSTAFGREVALKVIRAEFTGDEPFRRRFLREAHAISRLSHPNILPLIEFGEEQGRLYLVMPLVREGTLRDLLSQHNGPLSLEEALPLFVPLCDAVQYAHQEGIIHRDIKPQNILLQRHTHVLLADFGIARDRFDTRLTTTGVGIGSVEYMAPEQAEGRADARSDIYSLGIVLYQLLTGVVPYAGTLPLEVLFKKSNDLVPDPRRRNPHLPAEIVDILQMVLAREPDQRFETAEALGCAVQQVRPSALPAPLPRQAIWLGAPGAGVRDADLATTMRLSDRVPAAKQQENENQQRSSSASTVPAPAASAPTLKPANQAQHRRQGEPPEADTWAARSAQDERWSSQPTWNHRSNTPPGTGVSSQPARGKYALIIAALVAALLLMFAVSSIASGHLGLAWLHPGTANTGAQLLTPTPPVPPQPTQPTGSGSTTFPWPTAAPQQPVNTAPPQPTQPGATPAATPTSGVTQTPTPPSATATAQPTAPATPQPTDTPVPGPTDTPPPQPTATPPPGPATAPTLAPGSIPAPGAQATPTP
jgi:serine/threonine protein kinase